MKNIKIIAGFILVLLISYSCSKILDIEPATVLEENENYNDFTQTRTSLLGGNSALLRTIAPPWVVYNETRGDLLTVTSNASSDLLELENQMPGQSNSYTDPRPWYMVIMNCNDEIVKIARAKRKDPVNFKDADSIICYWETYATRAWAYLQLARMYKEVPFYTINIESINDMAPIMLTKEQLADTLLADLLPFPNDYIMLNGKGSVTGAETAFNRLRMTNYAVATIKGELYLLKKDYASASQNFLAAIRGDLPSQSSVSKNRISDAYAGELWTTIFDVPANATEHGAVFLVSAGFSSNLQKNYLYNLFLPTAPMFGAEKSYQLKPSEIAIKNWESQRFYYGKTLLPTDYYRGYNRSYGILNGNFYVNKFRNSTSAIFLYRDADLHLLWAEAINRVGYPDSAINVINPQNTTFSTFNTPMKLMVGIRGRAKVDSIPAISSTLPLEERISLVEEAIINEQALECAFEGYRWYTLVRFAERMNAEGKNGTKWLADRVTSKFSNSTKVAEVHARLMNPDNWYLTFPLDKLPTKYKF